MIDPNMDLNLKGPYVDLNKLLIIAGHFLFLDINL